MQNQFESFLKVLKAFAEFQVEYILVGGVALVLHGMERLTRDVDVFVKNQPENIERLQKALSSVFRDKSIEEITVSELNKYPVIRYGTPVGFNVDLLTKIGEAFSYEDLDFEIIHHQNVEIRIATAETLLKLKKNTIRERDRIDSHFLTELINSKKEKNNRRK
jgi:hypothetical protein